MAGGKETPRQKMIGMMYLVLTALLALNVTKEVVNAFVTINDKLDSSADIIDKKVLDDYLEFDQKKMTLIAQKEDMTLFNLWSGKADSLASKTDELVGYLLGECNEMIKEAEGEDWIAEDGTDENGNIIKLKPLMEIKVKDNYDIPTQIFIGSNPKNPIQRGLDIRNRIHEYRNFVTETMGTYEEGEKKWVFNAPEDSTGLKEALKTVKPEDASKIAHFYTSLTIPETLHDHGEDQEMPWVSVTFNHAPLVAAAAMFTSLKVDVKNAESIASEFMLDKIKAPPFPINKIEPMAIASTGYINVGDSLELNVGIVAYDTTEVYKLRWGMDADTLPERWKETTGSINLDGAAPGIHHLKGVIGVRERGGIVWKPWEFDYTVGQPMGVISQPEMRVLYRGYDNVLEATASGFPSDKVTLRGNGCSVRRQGEKWIATVGSGVRNASISVIAQNDDGSTVNVGTFDYKIKGIPAPELYFGSIKNGDNVSRGTAGAQGRVRASLGAGVTLTNVNFTILDGVVSNGGMTKGNISRGGVLDESAKRIIRQSSGKTVVMIVRYSDPSNVVRKGSITFNVR